MTDTTELRAAFEKWAFDQPDFSTMVPWDVASLAFQAGHASATQQHEGLRKALETMLFRLEHRQIIDREHIAEARAALSVAGDMGEAA